MDAHRGLFAGYEGGEEMPLRGYATLLGAWTAFFGAAYLLARRDEADSQATTPFDLVVLGLATHKLSRIVTHDWVTSPVRAPFVRYKESTGSGEVHEKARRDGQLRQAMGDLLTCPWCIGPWVATTLVGGMAVAPRFTRIATMTFAVVALSDWLHEAYEISKQKLDTMAENN